MIILISRSHFWNLNLSGFQSSFVVFFDSFFFFYISYVFIHFTYAYFIFSFWFFFYDFEVWESVLFLPSIDSHPWGNNVNERFGENKPSLSSVSPHLPLAILPHCSQIGAVFPREGKMEQNHSMASRGFLLIKMDLCRNGDRAEPNVFLSCSQGHPSPLSSLCPLPPNVL